MTSAPLAWFRCELAADGTLLSCRRVEASSKDGTRVFYRQARSEKDAGRLAFLAYQRMHNKRRRRQYIKEKRCPYCGRPQDREAGKRCSVCLKNHATDNARAQARKLGEEVEKPDPKVARKERREVEDQAIRLEVLEEVAASWKKHNNVWSFVVWLRGEIKRLKGGKAA